MRRHIFGIVLALFAVLGGTALVTTASPAHANLGSQWCSSTSRCLNAWNGGPAVKDYDYPAANNDFAVVIDPYECNQGITTSTCPGHSIPSGLNIVMFVYTGTGQYNFTCIEDNGNSQYDAKASVGGNCNGTGGWGSNFVDIPSTGCSSGYDVYYDIHWANFLLFNPNSNGNQAYLNASSGNCLQQLPPA